MATCELCGATDVGTRKASASGAVVDACRRCIERLGLQEMTSLSDIRSPVQAGRRESGSGRSSGGYGGMGRAGRDIMVKRGKELASDFAKRVRIARTDAGLDQRGLASRIGERLNMVQRIEKGNRPTDGVIDRLERELGVELWVEREAEATRRMPRRQDRSMTLGDLLDDQLKRD